jgi:hypothetical protein
MYFHHDNKKLKHIVVNNILNLLKVSTNNSDIFFDVKTTYKLYLQRQNCCEIRADYALRAAKKSHIDNLRKFENFRKFNDIDLTLMKTLYLEANNSFLKHFNIPYIAHKPIYINDENLIIELKHYEETINNYFAKLKYQQIKTPTN